MESKWMSRYHIKDSSFLAQIWLPDAQIEAAILITKPYWKSEISPK